MTKSPIVLSTPSVSVIGTDAAEHTTHTQTHVDVFLAPGF